MVLGRIIEQVNMECHSKNDTTADLYFLITSPDPYSHFIFGLYLSKLLKYFYDTAELQWLEHLWNHEKMFETVVVRAYEC